MHRECSQHVVQDHSPRHAEWRNTVAGVAMGHKMVGGRDVRKSKAAHTEHEEDKWWHP